MKSRDGSLQSQSFPLESQEDRSPCWKHYLYLRVYLRQLVMSHPVHQLWVSPCESETDPSGMFALAGCLSRCLQTPVKIPLGTSHCDELRICQANVLACDGGTDAVWQLEGCRLQAPHDPIKLSVSNILNPNLQCWYLAWHGSFSLRCMNVCVNGWMRGSHFKVLWIKDSRAERKRYLELVHLL